MSTLRLTPIHLPNRTALYDTNFEILKRYLEDESLSSSEAALAATAVVNSCPVDGNLVGSVSSLWGAIMDIVQQIPYDHPWAHRLISLLNAITKMPRPERPDLYTVENYNVGMGHFWDVLPAFTYAVFGSWPSEGPWDVPLLNFEDANGRAYGKPFGTWNSFQWLSVNAFMARCTGTGIPGASFPRQALQLLNHALEMKRTAEGLDIHVPSATAWILYAGRWLYENEDTSDRVRGVALGSEGGTWFYHGPEGYSKERWEFWKKRFGREVENVEVKEQTRVFARMAVDEMMRVEQGGQLPL